MTAALSRSFDSLHVPNYRRYFAGQVVSLSGNWMQMVAETWLILELTGSGFAVGLTAAFQFLPFLLFAAYGGLLADRYDKRRLLMLTQGLMAVPALVLWSLTASGSVEPWMVFALVFIRGSVNAVDNPARQAFVIEMVGSRRLVNAVNLNSLMAIPPSGAARAGHRRTGTQSHVVGAGNPRVWIRGSHGGRRPGSAPPNPRRTRGSGCVTTHRALHGRGRFPGRA